MITLIFKSIGLWPLFLGTPILIWLLTAFYRLYLHPLRNIPGHKSWAVSLIPFARSLVRGHAVRDIGKQHRQYGHAVRVGPNAVSFAHPDAWRDTQSARASNSGKPYLKDKQWWTSFASKSDSITTAIEHDKHAAIRRVLAPAFTTGALKQQEVLIQRGVALLMQRFQEKIQSDGKSEAFDIIPWFNFVAFDIFGDLGYGEAFDCLQTSNYHPFIKLMFDSLKAATFMMGVRLFPTFQAAFKKIHPYLLARKQNEYGTAVVDKVNRRMGWEVSRPDIMSHVITGNDKGIMTVGEIHATFQTLTVAGSETTATTMSGTLNQLIKNPGAYKKLVDEIRGSLQEESDITLDAIKDLPYLNAVINESMRMCPAAPFLLPRIVPKGGDLVCGTWVAGGTSVHILPWAVNHDPKLWHEVDCFHPERWLAGALEEKSPFYSDRRDALHPFGEGPRKCIGMNIAWAEARLILTRLLWAFDIELAGTLVDWEKQKVYVLIERAPLVVRLKKRDLTRGKSLQ